MTGDEMTSTTSMTSDRAAWPPPTPHQPAPPPTPPAEPREPGLDRSDIRPRPLPGRPLWVLFGSLLLIGGLFWGSFSVVSILAHDEWVVHYRQPAAGLTTLRVDGDAGRIVIRGADTDEVTVTAEVSRGLFGTDESAAVVGDTYELRSDCPPLGGEWCWVRYEITVPRDLDVVVDNEDSRVSVSDVDGNVEVSSDNGRVELSDITGPVVVRGDNGRIVGTDLASPSVDAETDNGSINLAFTDPPDSVVASGDNGSIRIALPTVDGGYAVDMQTDNGSQNATVLDNPESSRTIRAETDNGSINVTPTE